MTDNSDVYMAAKALVATIKASFVFKEQLAVLESFLLELLGLLKTERDKKWPYIHTLTLILKKLTYFLRLNFVVKERAPKELPVLRKVRTVLVISQLAKEYQGYFRELQNIVLKPDIKKKFSESYLSSFFSEEEEQQRISTDIKSLLEEFAKLSFKTCFEVEDDIHDDFGQIKQDLKKSLEMEEGDSSFDVFDRKDFSIFLNDIDERLLVVNRNILMQVATPQKSQKRLQKTLTDTQLDFSVFKDEDLSHRFRGVWGDFSFAWYTPYVSKQQRKRNQQAGVPPIVPKRVLVQRVTVNELSSRETVALGYNVRHFEMNSEEVSKAKSVLKFYGHYRKANELFIVSESVQMNLAEVYQTKKGHVFTGKEVVEVALAVSNALKYLHYNAMIHGDIRPENVFFTNEGFKGEIKLANFSHSLEIKDLFAQESKQVAYKAPETLEGTKYESSDVYSLSIVIWNLLHPDSLPYDYPTTSADEIKHEISLAVKPMIKYEDHCKNLDDSKRLGPEDWSNVAEMLQFMWNQEPMDRPSSSLCYDFFKLQNDTIGTAMKRTSVFIVQQSPSLRKKESENDPINEEEPPELPPRTSSVHSGRISGHISVEDGNTKNFQPYVKPLKRGTNVPRVKSRGRMEKPLDITRLQEKHDSQNVSTRDRSEVSKAKQISVGLTQPAGVDNISADKIRNELEMFRESLDLDGKTLHNFNLEDEVQYCLKHGLVEFHHKMRRKHGRGLKRFEGTGPEITTIPKKKANPKKKVSKKEDDDVVGLNGMAKHLKKQMRESRMPGGRRGSRKNVELEVENDGELLSLDNMAKHLKKQLKKEKRLSMNAAGSKLRRVNTTKGGVIGRVKSLRPFTKTRLGRKGSQASSAGGDSTRPNLNRLMTGKGSKLTRRKRLSSTGSSSGPEV